MNEMPFHHKFCETLNIPATNNVPSSDRMLCLFDISALEACHIVKTQNEEDWDGHALRVSRNVNRERHSPEKFGPSQDPGRAGPSLAHYGDPGKKVSQVPCTCSLVRNLAQEMSVYSSLQQNRACVVAFFFFF